ncbi:MAG: FHA domain-containing protein [Thermoguttaceae bacterium]|nr:FHA domain-containing protein [Thermoguttaceae bacterium]
MKRFTIIKGNDTGTRFDWDGKSLVIIGRGADCALRVNDKEASRRHASIQMENGELILTDLGSLNGTFVNAQKIERLVLQLGDHIQIGQTLLSYTETEDDVIEAPSICLSPVLKDISEESQIVEHYRNDDFFTAGGKPSFPAGATARTNTDQSGWFKEVNAHLNMIYRTTLAVSQVRDIRELLERILGLIIEWVDIDRSSILLIDPETHETKLRVCRQKSKKFPRITSISKRFSDYVLTNKEGILLNDRDYGQGVSIPGVREAICVPMIGRYGSIGVIYLDIVSPPDDQPSGSADGNSGALRLTKDHLKLVCAIAHQTALAVEDTQNYIAALQAERLAAIGQTVAVLSHHIKNILQGIRGGSYLIERGLTNHDEEMVSKGWGVVDKNQNKISDLILDMLTFSRERVPVLTRADINQTLLDVFELIQGRAMDLGVDVKFIPRETIPKFFYDTEQIHRAVMNLAGNALDAALLPNNPIPPENDQPIVELRPEDLLTGIDDTPSQEQTLPNPTPNPEDFDDDHKSNARVEIRSDFDPERKVVSIIVDDNGPGIPKTDREDVFRPFFSRCKSGGTGLGLPVSAKIIKEHDGKIVVSDSPLGGARFTVELPFRQER